MEAGREFQLLEVIGTNVLANEVIRHFSNLTTKECWESEKRVLRAKHGLGGIIDFNSSDTCRDSINFSHYYKFTKLLASSTVQEYVSFFRYSNLICLYKYTTRGLSTRTRSRGSGLGKQLLYQQYRQWRIQLRERPRSRPMWCHFCIIVVIIIIKHQFYKYTKYLILRIIKFRYKN